MKDKIWKVTTRFRESTGLLSSQTIQREREEFFKSSESAFAREKELKDAMNTLGNLADAHVFVHEIEVQP